MSNLAFEVFRSFHNDKYIDSLVGSIKTYATTASSPRITLFEEATVEIRKITDLVKFLRDHANIEASAYEGLLIAYDEHLQQLINNQKKKK